MIESDLQRQHVRYTILDAAGDRYELTCRVALDIDKRGGKTMATFQPEPGQFRLTAIVVLLADVRTIYVEALNFGRQLPRLGDHVVLELAEPVPADDVSWMTFQAWRLGIELEVRQPLV